MLPTYYCLFKLLWWGKNTETWPGIILTILCLETSCACNAFLHHYNPQDTVPC